MTSTADVRLHRRRRERRCRSISGVLSLSLSVSPISLSRLCLFQPPLTNTGRWWWSVLSSKRGGGGCWCCRGGRKVGVAGRSSTPAVTKRRHH
ncbi:hypothetical protein Hanom_Chr07g00638341 [Helianthus anomalus]